jgi:hypothetical protein
LLPQNLQGASSKKNWNQIDGCNLEHGIMSSGEILASRETSTRPGSGISPGGELSDTSVLKLNVTETVETGLVSIGDEV